MKDREDLPDFPGLNGIFIILLLALAAIFSATARAQETQDSATKPQATKSAADQKKELENKALVLLDQLLTEAASFRVENRIMVLNEVCQLLWTRDPVRSRKILDELRELTSNPELIDRQNLRMQISSWLAAKNPELALEFLRSTRAPDSADKGENDKQLEAGLAANVAANNQQMALRMAEELLNTDNEAQVIDIWASLRQHDPQLSAKLGDDILAQLKTRDILSNQQDYYVAYNLQQQLKASQENSESDRRLYRDLLDLMAGSALKFMSDKSAGPDSSAAVSGQELLTTINSLMPEIESQLPARAAALRGKVAQYEKVLPQQQLQYSEYDRQIQKLDNKTGEELLETASSAPPLMRPAVLNDAMAKATAQGDLETARNIARIHGTTYPQLKQNLSQLEGEYALKSACEGNYDVAMKALSNVGTDEEKIAILIQSASCARDRKDEKMARGFLEEAGSLLGDRMRTNLELSAQVELAKGYRESDPNRSFELMGAVIDRLNQVLAAAREYFAFTGNDDFETSVISGQVRELFAPVGPGLAEIAHADFDRTSELLNHMQFAEVRVRLGLAILSDILGEKKQLQ